MEPTPQPDDTKKPKPGFNVVWSSDSGFRQNTPLKELVEAIDDPDYDPADPSSREIQQLDRAAERGEATTITIDDAPSGLGDIKILFRRVEIPPKKQ